MRLAWNDRGWEEYLYWQTVDKKIVKKINKLVEDIKRNPFTGIGKPEQLKHELSSFLSRRITEEHRLVYKVEDDIIIIVSCRYHYEK
jgi:toxin YoeB